MLIDYMLGDDDGLQLALEFQSKAPSTRIVMMTGGAPSEEELTLCREREIPILFKPFLAEEVLNLIRYPMLRPLTAAAGSGGFGESALTADPV